MIGKPKFKKGDVVTFTLGEKEIKGKVFVVDKYGIFCDRSDVHYDIVSEDGSMLYKHIEEEFVRKGGIRMNFNTQICTTREQSERLLALGLKKETADMSLLVIAGEEISRFEGDINIGGNVCVNGIDIKGDVLEYVPAWSLHRLMGLCPQSIHLDDYADTYYYLRTTPFKVIYQRDDKLWLKTCDEGNIYDRMVDMIDWLIKQNHFNKEYLEESK